MKISIEGNIGCGKSTLISRLCQETRMPVFLEPVDEWKEWLTLFYADPERWGMSFNTNVLLTFNRWKHNMFPAVYERSPISNKYVFSALQRMNDLERALFDQLYAQLAWTPDVMIYVRTDPNVAMERMRTRARSCEDHVPLEYLKAVHDRYEKVVEDKLGGDYKIIVIDGDRSAEEVYQDVLKVVKGMV